jgi:deazaflavin-dependent oxidoreductase (nitroreductase family)
VPDQTSDQVRPGRDRSEAVRTAAQRSLAEHSRNFFVRSAGGGRALSALMMPFFMVRPPKGYAAITTTGRKSGKPRRKCVRAIRSGSSVYVVMLRPPVVAMENPDIITAWVLNIRSDPNVSLRLRGGEFPGLARELAEPDELQKARDVFCEAVVPFDYGECNVHLRGLPNRNKIRELNRYWFDTGVPLAIDLAIAP